MYTAFTPFAFDIHAKAYMKWIKIVDWNRACSMSRANLSLKVHVHRLKLIALAVFKFSQFRHFLGEDGLLPSLQTRFQRPIAPPHFKHVSLGPPSLPPRLPKHDSCLDFSTLALK